MNKFVKNIPTQEARTQNNMKALKGSGDACVDLFYKIGAMRGQNVIPAFLAAYEQEPEIALRIALWARDVRGGAGEKKIYRDILKYLETHDPDSAYLLMNKTPEVGRWDDLFVLDGPLKDTAEKLYTGAIMTGNGLAAKWAPRKGPIAERLRLAMGVSPKHYRKILVKNTQVVEQQMCARDWDNINFSHVPSRAAKIYRRAFYRHTTKYAEYVNQLVKGTDPKVKINASAIYPHDVIAPLFGGFGTHERLSKTELDSIREQWKALPNYMSEQNVLAMVDVSGSMYVGSSNVAPIRVAIALGLYVADKMSGDFQDTFLTFSGAPSLSTLSGDIVSKVNQMSNANWGMNTNLHAAFEKVLDHAIVNSVPAEDMPSTMLILSDMQFDRCVHFDDSAMQMIRRKYEDAGYEIPQIVFWNLNAADNVPVKMNEHGVALVSGFSPAIMESILQADMEEFSPKGIMLKTLMKDRYNLG